MSGPSVGGGGRGDPFGNIFGSGGGDKQVYPPAPPGYKYVDLNIPQAPPGYSVAKMSGIANNQSTPATAYGAVGNAGLYSGGTGARTTFQFPAHTPQGIRERAESALKDRMMRANTLNELQGLAPQYQIPGQQGAAPGAIGANPYGGGQGYRPPPSAMISGTPWATVNPGPGNVTQSMMPGTPLALPVAGPVGAPSVMNPMVPSGAGAKPAAPIDPAKGGIVTLSNGSQALQIPGLDHLVPLKMTANGPVPIYPHPKISPEGAAERIAVQKFIGGLNLEATTNALNPPVAPPPVANPSPVANPPANTPPAPNVPPSNTPPDANATPPSSNLGILDALSEAWRRFNQPPVPQSNASGPPIAAPPNIKPQSFNDAVTAPYPGLAADMKYNPVPGSQDDEEVA